MDWVLIGFWACMAAIFVFVICIIVSVVRDDQRRQQYRSKVSPISAGSDSSDLAVSMMQLTVDNASHAVTSFDSCDSGTGDGGGCDGGGSD